MSKPILCLDFDGVVHSYNSGWKGADIIPDPPVDGALAFMLGALHSFDVVIFSSRSNQRGGINAMREWLKKHAGNCWYECPAGPGLEDVRFVTEKPPAFVGIDDRVITFTGNWPSVEELHAFKPWNPAKSRPLIRTLRSVRPGSGRHCNPQADPGRRVQGARSMSLPMDTARCDGGNCPSKKNCRRYTERSVKGDYVVNAALWLRREAGDSACDMVIWVEPVTTFKEES